MQLLRQRNRHFRRQQPTREQRFVVVLEGAAGADTTHAHTLRYLLKNLLRARSLRCVELRQVEHRDGVVRGRDGDGDEK